MNKLDSQLSLAETDLTLNSIRTNAHPISGSTLPKNDTKKQASTCYRRSRNPYLLEPEKEKRPKLIPSVPEQTTMQSAQGITKHYQFQNHTDRGTPAPECYHRRSNKITNPREHTNTAIEKSNLPIQSGHGGNLQYTSQLISKLPLRFIPTVNSHSLTAYSITTQKQPSPHQKKPKSPKRPTASLLELLSQSKVSEPVSQIGNADRHRLRAIQRTPARRRVHCCPDAIVRWWTGQVAYDRG